jgi:Ribbon-helix-helix protein, copG family
MVRSTYALDVETVRALERIAQAWRTSKSEALRRVIRAAAGEAVPEASDPLRALDGLQRTLGLTRAKARAWARATRDERRASSKRAERRIP